MEHIKKLRILSIISFLLIVFISCDSHRYNIIWNSFGVSIDGFITISFWNNLNSMDYKYKLIPNKTKHIVVPNNAKFMGEEWPADIKIVIYPAPSRLPNGGDLELFMFFPLVEQTPENEYKMERQEGVEAYFVKFSKDGKRYYAISKDEMISIQKEIQPDSVENIEQLLELILSEDVTFYDESGTNYYRGSELVWGGYIVKTSTDGNYLWLNSSLP
jgi:hypothetical protein